MFVFIVANLLQHVFSDPAQDVHDRTPLLITAIVVCRFISRRYHYQPYSESVLNRVELLALFTTLMTQFLCLLFYWLTEERARDDVADEAPYDAAEAGLTALLLVINVDTLLVFFFYLWLVSKAKLKATVKGGAAAVKRRVRKTIGGGGGGGTDGDAAPTAVRRLSRLVVNFTAVHRAKHAFTGLIPRLRGGVREAEYKLFAELGRDLGLKDEALRALRTDRKKDPGSLPVPGLELLRIVLTGLRGLWRHGTGEGAGDAPDADRDHEATRRRLEALINDVLRTNARGSRWANAASRTHGRGRRDSEGAGRRGSAAVLRRLESERAHYGDAERARAREQRAQRAAVEERLRHRGQHSQHGSQHGSHAQSRSVGVRAHGPPALAAFRRGVRATVAAARLGGGGGGGGGHGASSSEDEEEDDEEEDGRRAVPEERSGLRSLRRLPRSGSPRGRLAHDISTKRLTEMMQRLGDPDGTSEGGPQQQHRKRKGKGKGKHHRSRRSHGSGGSGHHHRHRSHHHHHRSHKRKTKAAGGETAQDRRRLSVLHEQSQRRRQHQADDEDDDEF